MGVTGLWTVVAPTARPTQLASLNRKRLAVDASIWIYQFLKAVRDKEGNALRNSHVVGFFRRICKLLYFGIKPVFVFDGGAPVLKRETIRRRARRREGRREDAARTAGKLLAVQVARAAEEEEKRRKAERDRTPLEDELPAEQELVYVEELGMTQKERQAGRRFKKKDQYHLPDLDVSLESMGAPNDPRIMSQAELEEYARQFHSGEDINLYDFSKIDFESPFFLSLPAGDRYNILNAARLRSRLRMGYSKEQLDGMFPDRMAFSKFQIERVKERNELTQRLMHINGMAEDFLNQGGRIAGEKGKEYILVKNDGVDGGWALGVVSNKQGNKKENAIDLDDEEESEDFKEDSADDEDFEDVAIEGLNRLPKDWQRKRKAADYDMSYEDIAEEIAKKRKAIYGARKAATSAPQIPRPTIARANPDEEALFVPEDKVADDDEDELFEDVLPLEQESEEDDDLRRAIAMSLEQPKDVDADIDAAGGGFVAEEAASRLADDVQDDDDGFDLQAALAESRRTQHKAKTSIRERSPSPGKNLPVPRFDGPLPFESLNLGQSILGKKKSKKIEQDLSGGFDRDLGEDAFRKERPPQPMPAWFNAAPSTNDLKPSTDDVDEPDRDQYERGGYPKETIRRQDTKEVIDLEAEDDINDPIELDDEGEDIPEPTQPTQADEMELSPSSPIEHTEMEEIEDPEKRKRDEEREKRYEIARQIAAEHEPEPILMNDVAETTRAQPPLPSHLPQHIPKSPEPTTAVRDGDGSDFEEVEWSESEHEQPASPGSLGTVEGDLARQKTVEQDEDEGEDFEDVDMPPAAMPAQEQDDILPPDVLAEDDLIPDPATGPDVTAPVEDEFGYLSESEEELMRQLAVEAEEHARFASSLNNQKSSTDAIRDYENELKQLRSQQKRDRRDADEVTHVMVEECQALLRLFGLPYITAPMEAEAQCAELVRLGLVDGIVTDDSDIFLFGGTRIYKNMFNAAKFVECYLASELEKEFLLDRRRLIRFAHLLGSDYTEGIPGVGPVTALEILTDFDTLEDFKEWCVKVQLGRQQDLENQLTTPFRRKFKKAVQKRLFLPTDFPDRRVDEAYLNPEVDSDPHPFQWGVPDLDKLRGFLMATIGWSQERTDEVLVPVIRDMNKRDVEGTQSNITRFFSGGVGVGANPIARVGAGAGDRGLAVGGGGGPAAAAASGVEGAAPRNRTDKESGRMRNAFKRLRGEAERRRKHTGAYADAEDADDDDDGGEQVEVLDGLDEPVGFEDDDDDIGADEDDADFAEDEALKAKGPARARAKGKAKAKSKPATDGTKKRKNKD